MDSDEGKVFIGGIAWDTSEDTLRDYFGQYGQVAQAVIMRDKPTGRPRGFGFVVFSDPSVLDRVLEERHTIDGRTVSCHSLTDSSSSFLVSQFSYFFNCCAQVQWVSPNFFNLGNLLELCLCGYGFYLSTILLHYFFAVYLLLVF